MWRSCTVTVCDEATRYLEILWARGRGRIGGQDNGIRTKSGLSQSRRTSWCADRSWEGGLDRWSGVLSGVCLFECKTTRTLAFHVGPHGFCGGAHGQVHWIWRRYSWAKARAAYFLKFARANCVIRNSRGASRSFFRCTTWFVYAVLSSMPVRHPWFSTKEQ